jgi:hypothetical protein
VAPFKNLESVAIIARNAAVQIARILKADGATLKFTGQKDGKRSVTYHLRTRPLDGADKEQLRKVASFGPFMISTWWNSFAPQPLTLSLPGTPLQLDRNFAFVSFKPGSE